MRTRRDNTRASIRYEVQPCSKTMAGAKARQAARLAEIPEALVAAGYDTTAKQAAVLGVCRATAWGGAQPRQKSRSFGQGHQTSSFVVAGSQESPPKNRTVRRGERSRTIWALRIGEEVVWQPISAWVHHHTGRASFPSKLEVRKVSQLF